MKKHPFLFLKHKFSLENSAPRFSRKVSRNSYETLTANLGTGNFFAALNLQFFVVIWTRSSGLAIKNTSLTSRPPICSSSRRTVDGWKHLTPTRLSSGWRTHEPQVWHASSTFGWLHQIEGYSIPWCTVHKTCWWWAGQGRSTCSCCQCHCSPSEQRRTTCCQCFKCWNRASWTCQWSYRWGKKIRLCLEFLEVKITHILLIDNSAAKQVAKKRGNGRLRDVSGTLLFGHRTKQTPRLWRSSKLEQRTMLATLARPLGQGSPLCLHVLAQPPWQGWWPHWRRGCNEDRKGPGEQNQNHTSG